MALTFIIHLSGRKKEKRRKAKASDSQIELVALKMPRVPLGSFFPSFATASFRGSQDRRSQWPKPSATPRLCFFVFILDLRWSGGSRYPRKALPVPSQLGGGLLLSMPGN